jgi:hypothetical protein
LTACAPLWPTLALKPAPARRPAPATSSEAEAAACCATCSCSCAQGREEGRPGWVRLAQLPAAPQRRCAAPAAAAAGRGARAHLLARRAPQRVQRAVHALIHVVQQRAHVAVHLVLLLTVWLLQQAGLARERLRAGGRAGGLPGLGGAGRWQAGRVGAAEAALLRRSRHAGARTLHPPMASCSVFMHALSLLLKAGTFL